MLIDQDGQIYYLNHRYFLISLNCLIIFGPRFYFIPTPFF